MIPLRDDVPSRTTPFVTWALIAACTLIYVWQLSLGERGFRKLVYSLGVIPATLLGDVRLPPTLYLVPPLATIFTSMFLHGSFMHLLGNMLYLWIFGNNVEDALGHARFLFWYLIGGIAAIALQTFVTVQWGGPHDASIPNIGASGAIAAVLGAYFLLLPRAKVLTAIFLGFFFFIQEVPAIVFLGVWIVLQALQGGLGILHPQQNGGVAVFAHIGGFAFGALTVYLIAKRRPMPPRW
jgi:membrane associated rhomboid family serine protease